VLDFDALPVAKPSFLEGLSVVLDLLSILFALKAVLLESHFPLVKVIVGKGNEGLAPYFVEVVHVQLPHEGRVLAVSEVPCQHLALQLTRVQDLKRVKTFPSYYVLELRRTQHTRKFSQKTLVLLMRHI
jgi:hypothetical protein